MMKIKPVRVDHTRDNVVDTLQRVGDAVDCLIAAHNAQVDETETEMCSSPGCYADAIPTSAPPFCVGHFVAQHLNTPDGVKQPERILPSGSSLADSYYKGAPWPDGGGASTVGLTVVQLATVEAILSSLYEKFIGADDGSMGIQHRLREWSNNVRADARRVVEGAIR